MTPSTFGFVDSVEGGFVSGWAAIEGRAEPAVVALLIDGVACGSVIADVFRDDLLAAGIGTGHHGYRLTVPPFYLDGTPHQVAVQVAGEGLLVPATERAVLGSPDPIADSVPDLPPPPPPPTAQPAPAPLSRSAPIPHVALGGSVELSVIMPTYGRGAVMEASLLRYLACARRVSAEIIVVDDGSRDDTPDRLRRLASEHPNLVTHRVDNGGPARARNLAAASARGRLLVFVGDDVSPTGDEFLSVHLAAHNRYPDAGTAILGKITWPDRPELEVNAVMAHIQGEGEQQFGYRSMTAYSWFDWRLFYSSNVSVKRDLVPDWMAHGYDASFPAAAFEDPEFALRTSLRLEEAGGRLGVFYVPAAHLVHHHPYSVAGFMARQMQAGMMARRFLELHAGRAADLGLDELQRRLALPTDNSTLAVEHYFSVIEGIKSWALVIESHYGLGQQNWHADLLRTVFRLSYLQGYLQVQSGAGLNIAAGARYLLEEVRRSMNRAIATEVLGELPGFGLV